METKLTFKKGGIIHTPLNFFTMSDGKIVTIYQGSRGQRPDLDFILKYKKNKDTKLRAPSHTHWIVDLIIKNGYSPDSVLGFVKDWYELYDKIKPFTTQEERNNYRLIYNDYFVQNYSELDNLTDFNTDFIACLIELFIKCEKQTDNAFMFKNMLKLIVDFCEGKKDYYQIISYSKRV